MWPNNPRVMVELTNEYVSSDFYPQMQSLVDYVRDAGYTNGIVVDKWWGYGWQKFDDPLDNTYQGMHYYMNSPRTASSYINNYVKPGLALGIKMINTEVGANDQEVFTSTEITQLNSLLAQSADLGVGSNIWMNENLDNWPKYHASGKAQLVIP